MVQARNLKQDEINEVQKVFQKSVDLSNVYICKPIRSEEGVITVAGWTGKVWVYQILWSTDVFDRSAIQANMHDTLVHEMTHVWQGQHGIYPTIYMAQSLWEQLSHGVKDIIDKGGWRTWNEHRGTAYLFNMADIGANWDQFNVEQQANIVETWYLEQIDNLKSDSRRGYHHDYSEGVYCGGASPYDPRYPYIRDVILTGKPTEPYKPVVLPSNANADIKKFQEKLVQLGFLPARLADGIYGGKGSQTRLAVTNFQKVNSLTVDGDLGGPNSQTRAKLNLPFAQLIANK